MRRLRGWFFRVAGMFSKATSDREIEEELESHLQMHVEDNIRAGMTAEEARRVAIVKLGGVEATKEMYRDARGVPALESVLQDIRFGLRAMRKSPGFTAVAALSLALGIGANTALFSVADSVLLRALPVKEPGDLVLFEWQAGTAFRTTGTSSYGTVRPPGTQGSTSFRYDIFKALEQHKGPLSDLFGFAALRRATITSDGRAEVGDGQFVSGGYFAGLGVPAVLGRTIAPEDDRPDAAPVAVLGYRFWKTRFGGDPSVIGKQIAVNKVPFTIVGVTPADFTGTLQVGTNPSVTIPISFEPAVAGDATMMGRPDHPGMWWMHIMGRLTPGATVDEARDSLDGSFQSLALDMMPPPRKPGDPAQLEAADYPKLLASSGAQGLTESRQYYSSKVYLLFGVVGLVLLVACANVANLLFARSAARRAEVAVRLAMGAGRWRVIRQLLTESLLLSGLGGAAGVAFAVWAKDALAATVGSSGRTLLPAGLEYAISWRVLAFTVVVSLATGIVFGLTPAFRSTRLDLASALKEGGRGLDGPAQARLSRTLVVVQVAMSLVLLVGAGLFVRTVRNLRHVEIGFDDTNLMVFALDPGAAGYEGERLVALYQRLFERIESLPGVRAATFVQVPLVANSANVSSLLLPGETPPSTPDHSTNRQIVRENFFGAMGIPLLGGRGFEARDRAGAPRVAVVSETLARRFFPDRSAVGQVVQLEGEGAGPIEIIGVVGDTKYNGMRDEIEPLFYTPWLQETDQVGRMTFAVRTAGDPMALAPAVRDAVTGVDAELPVANLMTQEAQSGTTIANERMMADLLSFFGVLAMLLAAIGLYGVMAYSVARRTKEIGVRVALGADRADILRLVVGQGLRATTVGLVVGVAAAFAVKRVVASQLYGVDAADPLTFAAVAVLLLVVAFVASLVPARRAAKVDPVVALRSE